MKKELMIMVSIVLFMAIFFVSCVKKEPVKPKAPVQESLEVVQGDGEVTFTWKGVAEVTYTIEIAFITEDNHVRKEGFPLIIGPLEDTTFTWVVTEQGTFSWRIKANNESGSSEWVSGENFIASPHVEYNNPEAFIAYPSVDNQVVDVLNPTITWNATPGEKLDGEERGDEIDSCRVIIREDGAEIHSGVGEHLKNAQWQYPIPSGLLDYGKDYSVTIIVKQGEHSTNISRRFKTQKELELTLSATSTYACEVLVATVTANNPDINKVALYGKVEGQTDFQKIAPDGNNWRKPDEVTRQATFLLNNNILDVGYWLINAQALGDTIKSEDQHLEVKKFPVFPILSLQVCEKEVSDGQYICVDPDDGFPLEGNYTVDIAFLDTTVATEIMALGWKFEHVGAPSEMVFQEEHVQIPFDYTSWEMEQIPLTMSTECTKHATLTVWGTACIDNPATFSEITTLDYTVDGALPEAEITFIPDTLWNAIIGGASDTITISFAATDTKSLCEATLSLFVYKVDENEVQMPGWEQVEIPWGVEEITIGTGDNKMIGEIEYWGNLSIPDLQGTASINGTLTLQSMGVLDFVPIFATLTVLDCCDANFCCDECGNLVGRKPVEAGMPSGYVLYDNAFFRQDLLNISFIDDKVEGYEDLGDSWLLTMNHPTGTATNVSIDFYVEWTDASITGDIETVETTILWEVDYEDYLAECTGFPWKEAYYDLLIMEATETVEGIIDIEIFNADVFLNATSLTQNIIIDTMSPTLTVVNGLKRYEGPGKDALQFSFRDEDTEQDVICLGATVTVISSGSIDSGERKEVPWQEYSPEYYDNSNGDLIVRINESESKTWIINPLYKNGALDKEGEVRLEVLAQDKYGNKGVSVMTGEVIDYSPGR